VNLLRDNIDTIKKNWKINQSEKMEIQLLEIMSLNKLVEYIGRSWVQNKNIQTGKN
jgi:hypothetical protein